MHGGNATSAQPALQAQIEIRGINADKRQRGIRAELPVKLAAEGQQIGQVSQHLHQPHDRQPFHRNHGLKTLSPHCRPADADKAELWIVRPKRRHQPCAEQIARQFTSNDSDVHRQPVLIFHQHEATAPCLPVRVFRVFRGPNPYYRTIPLRDGAAKKSARICKRGHSAVISRTLSTASSSRRLAR